MALCELLLSTAPRSLWPALLSQLTLIIVLVLLSFIKFELQPKFTQLDQSCCFLPIRHPFWNRILMGFDPIWLHFEIFCWWALKMARTLILIGHGWTVKRYGFGHKFIRQFLYLLENLFSPLTHSIGGILPCFLSIDLCNKFKILIPEGKIRLLQIHWLHWTMHPAAASILGLPNRDSINPGTAAKSKKRTLSFSFRLDWVLKRGSSSGGISAVFFQVMLFQRLFSLPSFPRILLLFLFPAFRSHPSRSGSDELTKWKHYFYCWNLQRP